jgi:hypothetical protein
MGQNRRRIAEGVPAPEEYALAISIADHIRKRSRLVHELKKL